MFSYTGESQMVNYQREEWFMLSSVQDFNQYWVSHLKVGWGREEKEHKEKGSMMVSVICMKLLRNVSKLNQKKGK